MNLAILLLTGGLVERGAENVMHLLANEWVKSGHNVEVFQTGLARSGALYQTHTISIASHPSSHKPTSFLGKIRERLYLDPRALTSIGFTKRCLPHLKKADIIIPTDGYWQVLLLKRNCSAPIVSVGHAGMGWTDADTLRLKPDCFVATSPVMAAWAASINPKVTIKTIPYPLDPRFSSPPQTQPTLSLPHPIVLTVAAFTAYKRVDAVIKAVAKTQGSLVMIGQGEEHHTLSLLAARYLPHRHLLTQVEYNILPGYYHAADVFTLASKPQEAYGQVLVEAMAAHLPIVTTDDPIRRWLVGKPGFYVNPTDSNAFAKALEAAVKAGHVTYPDLNRFTGSTVSQQYIDMVELYNKPN
jgi:glycosyltransferase involved in cell wall biosynthesis